MHRQSGYWRLKPQQVLTLMDAIKQFYEQQFSLSSSKTLLISCAQH